MKTLLIAVSALVATGAFSGCATSPQLTTSPLIPAAQASVKFDRTRNGNTEIDLRVKHLAEPEKLTPPAHTYVAWVRNSKEAAPQNIGALVVDKNLTGVLVGLNHSTAPVEIREAISPKSEEAGRMNVIISEATGQQGVVVLSTCSRFEIYCQADKDGEQAIIAWLNLRAGKNIGASLFVHRGAEAVAHLFHVAAGLDSMIMGETEILGQCKAAYQGACAEKTVNRFGHLSFQRALMVGKKVRNETRIVGGISSIGGAAAVMARSIFSDLKERVVVVFGAGTMAASSVRHLRSKGTGKLYISNRSLDKAQALAAELGGEPITLSEGFDRLDQADIAVFSTGADRYLLDGEGARALSRRRGGRSLFIIDIAMPRNVAPEVAHAEGVYLYDIDDLKGVVQKSLAKREDDMAQAADIVAAESSDCWARLTQQLPAAGRAPVVV